MKGLNWLLLGLVAASLLVLASGGGAIGQAAPFQADKLSVLVVEETEQRTTALANVLSAVEQHTKAAGGNWRQLDPTKQDVSQDEAWVQAAWKVKGATVPWIVAATPRSGVNQALPANEADALKLLSPLGVK